MLVAGCHRGFRMSATDGAFARWLFQAQIAEHRLTAEQLALLQSLGGLGEKHVFPLPRLSFQPESTSPSRRWTGGFGVCRRAIRLAATVYSCPVPLARGITLIRMRSQALRRAWPARPF